MDKGKLMELRNVMQMLPEGPWYAGYRFNEGMTPEWFDHPPAMRPDETMGVHEVVEGEENIPLQRIVTFAQLARDLLPEMLAEMERLERLLFGAHGFPQM